MKSISDVIDSHANEIARNDPSSLPTQRMAKGSGDFIHGIFEALKVTFPAWKQNFESDYAYNATKKLWLRTLIDEKITGREEISRGLKGARNHNSPFFPSIGQFMSWTRPAEVEQPRVNEQAYKHFVPKLSKHTREEYREMGERGMDKIKQMRGE